MRCSNLSCGSVRREWCGQSRLRRGGDVARFSGGVGARALRGPPPAPGGGGNRRDREAQLWRPRPARSVVGRPSLRKLQHRLLYAAGRQRRPRPVEQLPNLAEDDIGEAVRKRDGSEHRSLRIRRAPRHHQHGERPPLGGLRGEPLAVAPHRPPRLLAVVRNCAYVRRPPNEQAGQPRGAGAQHGAPSKEGQAQQQRRLGIRIHGRTLRQGSPGQPKGDGLEGVAFASVGNGCLLVVRILLVEDHGDSGSRGVAILFVRAARATAGELQPGVVAAGRRSQRLLAPRRRTALALEGLSLLKVVQHLLDHTDVLPRGLGALRRAPRPATGVPKVQQTAASASDAYDALAGAEHLLHQSELAKAWCQRGDRRGAQHLQ
mmetsp:Transcript_123290/g.356231  ORF Transcript_123290/g.356231 Transcript_123290/m.356231 type:complete len:375 (+) Transcript_123290:2845-3969(+)